MFKQEDFNAYFGRHLKQDANMIKYMGDYMADVRCELKLVSKHASMITTQVQQVLKAQNDLLNELNNKKNYNAIRVVTRGGKMTQEPHYPVGHPKIIEQDSQRVNTDAPSHFLKRKRRRKMIGLCKPLVNLLLNHLRIQMIYLFLMLKHNLVMNMNLMKMLMIMLNLVTIMM